MESLQACECISYTILTPRSRHSSRKYPAEMSQEDNSSRFCHSPAWHIVSAARTSAATRARAEHRVVLPQPGIPMKATTQPRNASLTSSWSLSNMPAFWRFLQILRQKSGPLIVPLPLCGRKEQACSWWPASLNGSQDQTSCLLPAGCASPGLLSLEKGSASLSQVLLLVDSIRMEARHSSVIPLEEE